MALLQSGTRIYGNAIIDTSLSISGSDTSTSNTTGALKVSGGIGVVGNVFSSGNITALNASLGNIVAANYYTGTLTTAAQPNITSVGTLTQLSVSGNATITGNLTVNGTAFYANVITLNVKDPIIEQGGSTDGAPLVADDGVDRGQLLHYYDLAPIDAFMGWKNANSEFIFASNASLTDNTVTVNSLGNVRANAFIGTFIGTADTAKQVTESTQSNITSVGTLTSLTVSGDITGTLATAAQPNITSLGNLTGLKVNGVSNVGPIGNLKITGGTNGYVLQTDGTGNLSWANLSSTLGNANVAGSNTQIQYNDGTNLAGSANLTFNAATSTLSVIGNITSTNALLGNLATANFFSGDGSLLTNLNIATANVANANFSAYTGTVTTNAQPNITSVGTLTSLTVSGTTNLGAVGNINIAGGTADYVLKTDGTGNLSWVAQPTASSITVDNFTGNGVQTQFTLSTTPANVNQTTVNYNGTTLLRGAYTLSGAVITFSGAPADGSLLEITSISAMIGTGGTSTYANSNVASYLPTYSGNLTFANASVTGNIIPTANVTYDLGSPTNRWKDLYLSSNTLHLGDTSISAADILPIDLDILPEVLTIQVAAPAAGDDTAWLWTWEQSTLPFARTTITNSPQLSVPLYRQGTYQINNFANEQTGSMTQAHRAKLKWIDGAGSDNLVSWAVDAGNVVMSHPSINNGANTTVQRFNITVPSTVTLPTLVAPNVSYTVSFANVGAYTIGDAATGDNKNIGPMYRGGTYTFNLDSSIANHPFYLTTDNGTNFVANTYFGEYTNGVTGSRNNGTTGKTTLTLVVDATTPTTLYYQCGVHSMMRGAITIKDLAVETNVNGNPVLYFQHSHEGHKTPVEIRPLPSLVNQMCVVYDASTGKFVPQDLATYVENTPSFKNKIREVAGTATLVAADGVAVVPTVSIVEDATYLPLVGNKDGDITYAQNTATLYIWNNNNWTSTKTTTLAGSAITGAVANATYATTAGSATTATTATTAATANSVAGANVSGTVANATYATTSGSSTTATTADTANSVAGANVTGAVSFATTANAVAGANVSGIVANATYATTAGTAATALAVAGANVSGQVANALVSGTVYTNAQPNITSVGTLTSLAVTGNVTAGNASLGNLITANFFSGNGSLLTGITASAGNAIVNGTSNITVVNNANVNISAAGNANVAVITGTGANINGTLAATGNVSLTGANVSLGSAATVKITGGSKGQILVSDGAGGFVWENTVTPFLFLGL